MVCVLISKTKALVLTYSGHTATTYGCVSHPPPSAPYTRGDASRWLIMGRPRAPSADSGADTVRAVALPIRTPLLRQPRGLLPRKEHAGTSDDFYGLPCLWHRASRPQRWHVAKAVEARARLVHHRLSCEGDILQTVLRGGGPAGVLMTSLFCQNLMILRLFSPVSIMLDNWNKWFSRWPNWHVGLHGFIQCQHLGKHVLCCALKVALAFEVLPWAGGWNPLFVNMHCGVNTLFSWTINNEIARSKPIPQELNDQKVGSKGVTFLTGEVQTNPQWSPQ